MGCTPSETRNQNLPICARREHHGPHFISRTGSDTYEDTCCYSSPAKEIKTDWAKLKEESLQVKVIRDDICSALMESHLDFSSTTCDIIVDFIPFLEILSIPTLYGSFPSDVCHRYVEEGLVIKFDLNPRSQCERTGALISCFGIQNGVLRNNHLYRFRIDSIKTSLHVCFGITCSRDALHYFAASDNFKYGYFAGLSILCSRNNPILFVEYGIERRIGFTSRKGEILGFWLGQNRIIPYVDNKLRLDSAIELGPKLQNDLYLAILGGAHDVFTILHPVPIKPEDL